MSNGSCQSRLAIWFVREWSALLVETGIGHWIVVRPAVGPSVDTYLEIAVEQRVVIDPFCFNIPHDHTYSGESVLTMGVKHECCMG